MAIVVAVALLGAALVIARPSETGVSFAGELRGGGHLDALSLPALEGDDRLQYARFADRPLVLNFFASWCPSCIMEMPAFERLHRELGDEVRFLGVAQSDARSASVELVQRTGITYSVGVDPSGRFFSAWGPFGMPTTVFIRPGGRVAYVYAGGLDEATLRQLIERYLGVGA